MTRDDDLAPIFERHRRELRVHCYRMLGSASDCDDVVQDALLRAWNARASLRDASAARAWLYRIATNVCLDELARRPRRMMAQELGPAADPDAPLAAEASEIAWLEPMPDTWLVPTPEQQAVRRESVALAFIEALQRLTPAQRAVLLLRDIAELSADETAEALGITTSAANSALFRAREAVHVERSLQDVDPDLVSRYVRAFESNDTAALVSLLRDDIRTTMPPSPTWIDGLAANARFYGSMFARLPSVRLIPTAANGQPAFGFYRATPGEPHRLRAVNVITVRNGRIAAIDHFTMPSLGALFALPELLTAA